MSLESITEFFGWTAVLNIAILFVSTIGLTTLRGFAIRIQGRMFGLDPDDLSRAYFQYVAQYKIAVIVFSLVPYLALKIMA
ncbi:MAG: DUF6868 family protein [Gammaproteobacteria bacterium]